MYFLVVTKHHFHASKGTLPFVQHLAKNERAANTFVKAFVGNPALSIPVTFLLPKRFHAVTRVNYVAVTTPNMFSALTYVEQTFNVAISVPGYVMNVCKGLHMKCVNDLAIEF